MRTDTVGSGPEAGTHKGDFARRSQRLAPTAKANFAVSSISDISD